MPNEEELELSAEPEEERTSCVERLSGLFFLGGMPLNAGSEAYASKEAH
jgi:hypothetical protein